MDDRKVSKFISLVLRHKPETVGIGLDEHGWADVLELLAGVGRFYPLGMDDLERIVAQDEKQRYSFNEDKTKIRANQGHSVNGVWLTKLVPAEYLISLLFHRQLPGNWS